MADISSTDIVRGAYRLMGRPSQSDIRYQDVVDNARDVVNGRLLDMKMSNRNHTAQIGDWRTPTAVIEDTQNYVQAADFFIPVKCEWRYLNSDESQIPRDVEFCAVESIDALRTVPQDYASIYDNNSKIKFDVPVETLATRQYRLTYESLDLSDLDALGTEFDQFPAFFITVCQYETAALSINQVDNETEEWIKKRERLLTSIVPNLTKWDERFEKWKSQRFGNRKVYKVGYQRPGRGIY